MGYQWYSFEINDENSFSNYFVLRKMNPYESRNDQYSNFKTLHYRNQKLSYND